MEVVQVVGMKTMIPKEGTCNEGALEAHTLSYIFPLFNFHRVRFDGFRIRERFWISISTQVLRILIPYPDEIPRGDRSEILGLGVV
jgi:hypothetical protein